MFNRISELASDNKFDKDTKLKHILDYITVALQITQSSVLFVDKTTVVSGDGYHCNIDDECLDIFANLTSNDTLFIPSGLFNIAKHKKLNQFLVDNKIITFMISKVAFNKKTFGYIVLFEDKITRIWQEKEAAVCLYLNKIIEILYK